jgi:hypothetical protein
MPELLLIISVLCLHSSVALLLFLLSVRWMVCQTTYAEFLRNRQLD